MKLKIEYMKADDLKPYANNAKVHDAEQIEQIKKSIQDFGMNDPIAVWKNNEIIEGHGRLIACLELGIDKVPVIHLDDLTDEQRRAYMLVHNQLTMNTGFDDELLEIELENLGESVDMSTFGFDLSKLMEDEDIQIVDDEYDAEVPETPRTKRGDIYVLGRHKLMCGDALRADDVKTLLGGGTTGHIIHQPAV